MPTGVGGMMKTLMDEYAEIAVEAKRENAELRERAEKAERQAAKLAELIDTWEVECPNDMHMWQCKVFTDNAECPKNQAECWLEWAAQP